MKLAEPSKVTKGMKPTYNRATSPNTLEIRSKGPNIENPRNEECCRRMQLSSEPLTVPPELSGGQPLQHFFTANVSTQVIP